jgi:phosphoglycolate phosphatase-like HAD superfamily hydrolase
MSIAKGTAIFVYDLDGTLVNSFTSARKAAEFIDCSHVTILKHIKNNKLFQGKWRLTLSAKE